MDPKFLEIIFDLAYDTGYHAAGGEYIADDSRIAFITILSWAHEFHDSFTTAMDENGEYLERITDFFEQKFTELK